MSNLLLPERFDERFQDFKIMEAEFALFALVLKVPAPENLQMGLIRKAILILVTNVLKQKLQKCLFILPKRKVLCAEIHWAKNNCECRQHIWA